MTKSLFTIILASLLTLTACSPAADTKESSDVTPTEAATEATTEAPTEKSTENVIEDSSATEKKFTCYVDGQRVGGRLYHPEGEGPFPTIVFVPGMGMNYYLYAELFENLNSEGIAVAAFDCRGNAQISTISDGKFSEMTPTSLKKDIMEVTDFISAHQTVDSENLFIMGHSLGGLTAALTAAETPDKYKGMIGFDPSYQMPDAYRELYPEGTEIPEAPNVQTEGKAFIEEIMSINVVDEIKSYDGNTIILTGTNQTVYTEKPEIMEAAAEALPNGELIIVEGADHGFDKHLKELVQYTVDFVKENTD
ncbi:MAG: alpha/beta fold hydrolase [Ruminococcus sp.]|nr:alpha/beta fold hydrolase [Ruminococcus sp.]